MSAEELRGFAYEVDREDPDRPAQIVANAVYLGFAALIDALPNERERAELAALTGISSVLEAYQRAEGMMPHNMITGLARGAAAALLAQRQAESEGK